MMKKHQKEFCLKMTVYRAMKTKIYPNKQQKILLTKAIGVARLTKNVCLDKLKKDYKNNIKHNYFSINKWWNSIKKIEYPFVNEVSKFIQEYAIRDLDKLVKKVYDGKNDFPDFVKKGENDSFKITGSAFFFIGKIINLPKGLSIKMGRSLRWEPLRIFNVTISKKGGEWFAAIQMLIKQKSINTAMGAVGIDLGVSTLATLSTGEKFSNPKAEKIYRKKIAYLSRSLSRKKKYSRNWYKAKRKLAKTYMRLTNVRKDAINKMTANISSKYEIIALERLHIKEMLKNNKLAKYISDASLYEVRKQLEYKAKKVKYVNRYYPSSQICSICNRRNEEVKSLSVREWRCPKCGTKHDRDVNAARNILVAAGHKVKPVDYL